MKFAEVFHDVVPVASDETVRPTRVSWLHVNRQFVSRVFPTYERALEFAMDKQHAVITDVSEPIPEPPSGVSINRHRLNVEPVSGPKLRSIRE